MPSEDKYTIVLAIRLTTHIEGAGHDNLERFMRIGMRSYDKFLDKTTLHEFIVICPKKDVGYIRDKLTLAYPLYPWRFVDEDTIVSKDLPPGWAKQQMSKFTVSRLVQTKLYLIIDDDTYLTKPFRCEDLRWNGRVIMNKVDIDFVFFFLWSSQLLQVDYDSVQNLPHVMGITPEVFVVDVVKDLMKWLETTYGKMWQQVLMNHKFTEYAMYWIFLAKNKLADLLYATAKDSPSVYGCVTSGPEHDLGTQVQKSFVDNANFWFSFVQSSLPHDVSTVEKVVAKYLV